VPTVCVAPTHASGNAADREALRPRTARLEALREEGTRHAYTRAIGAAA